MRYAFCLVLAYVYVRINFNQYCLNYKIVFLVMVNSLLHTLDFTIP